MAKKPIKPVKAKKPTGRPNESTFDPQYLESAAMMAREGWTDLQMAEFFGVTRRTFQNWKKRHKDLFLTLKTAKAVADMEITNSLYNRARGFSSPDVHIATVNGQLVTIPIQKYHPPETMACIYWLNNRKPEKWKQRSHVKHEEEKPAAYQPYDEETQRLAQEDLLRYASTFKNKETPA